MRNSAASFVLVIASLLGACTPSHGDHCLLVTATICAGERQIRACDGMHFGEPEDCPAGYVCVEDEPEEASCEPASNQDVAEQVPGGLSQGKG